MIKILKILKNNGKIKKIIKIRERRVEKHADWCEEILKKYENITAENIENIIKVEIGIAFSKVLENAGVYKQDEEGKAGYRRFIEFLNK